MVDPSISSWRIPHRSRHNRSSGLSETPPMARVSYISIIESCYREPSSDQEWLAGVLDAASGLLERGAGYGFSTERSQGARRTVELADSRGVVMAKKEIDAIASSLDATAFDVLFYPPTPIIHVSALIRDLAPPARDLMGPTCATAGAKTCWGWLGTQR